MRLDLRARLERQGPPDRLAHKVPRGLLVRLDLRARRGPPDRLAHKQISQNIGTFPNTTGINHTMITFPTGKTLDNGKIRITAVWFERNSNEWFHIPSNCFHRDWQDFHLFYGPTGSSGGTALLGWTGSLSSHWSRRYRIEYVEYA